MALAIADERPDARVFATDLSPEAVALARENAGALGSTSTVVEGDLLEPLPDALRGHVDAVVSNPPYVSPDVRDSLPPDVRAEPELAVFGGVELYERLFAQAARGCGPAARRGRDRGARGRRRDRAREAPPASRTSASIPTSPVAIAWSAGGGRRRDGSRGRSPTRRPPRCAES